jgi:hypothetical protein
MNYLKLTFIGILFFISCISKSQVSVNINIGSPPQWGPIGYTEVRYYYLPDVEAYYDIQSSVFIYYGNGGWLHRSSLPLRYKNYDLYGGYKVVLTEYKGDTPYDNFKEHKMKYKKGYRGKEQKCIGEKPGKGNSKKDPQSKSAKQTNPDNSQKLKQDNSPSDNHGSAKQSHGNGKGKKK